MTPQNVQEIVYNALRDAREYYPEIEKIEQTENGMIAVEFKDGNEVLVTVR